MSRARTAAVLCVLVSTASPAAGLTRILPGVASANGRNGTRFESTVWIANLGAAEATFTLSFVSAAGSTPTAASFRLNAGESRRLDDPLRTLFGLSETFGTLVATSSVPFALRGRTDNVASASGRYGLALTSLPREGLLLASETGVAFWAANGTSAGARSNVTVAFLSPARVQIAVYDESGFIRGTKTLEVASPRTWQGTLADIGRESDDDLLSDAELPLARVELRVLEGEATGYVSVVDDVTGDGLLAPFERVPQATTWLLDGVARVSGRNGTHFTTDVRLYNPSLSPNVVVARPAALPPGARLVSRTIPPRGTIALADILGPNGAALPEGTAGAISVTGDRPLVPRARVVNRDPSGRPGTFGDLLPPIPADALLAAGDAVVFVGLSDETGTSGSRTNLAFLSTGGSTVDLTLIARSGAVLTSKRVDVPFGWTQQSLSAWVGAAIPFDSRLDVSVVSGSLDVYASVVDNGTGDAVVLRGTPKPAAGCTLPDLPSLVASTSDIAFGDAVTLTLNATGPANATARIVPGDLPIPLSGSIVVHPTATTMYRAVVSGGCTSVASDSVLVRVTPPLGVAVTEYGAVRGTVDGGTISTLGLPYVAPALFDLRYRPPVPAEPWDGVRASTSFSSSCPQLDANGKAAGDEDCLTLNVFTPSTPSSSPRPVLVFVHGGAHIEGSSNLALYDGRALAKLTDSVVVTFNYRLGALGYLAHPALDAESARHVSGNYGLLDEVAAFSFVKRNVAAFGGDPSRVLLFGESAGGYDVCALLASPLSRGLFSRALSESGGCASITLADTETFGKTIVKAAGCESASDVAVCLRGKSASDIVLAVPGKSPLEAVAAGQKYVYNVDGWALPEPLLPALDAGRRHPVPAAFGTNAQETAFFVPFVVGPLDYQAYVLSFLGPVLGVQALARYPVFSYPSAYAALVDLTSDAVWHCPTRKIARALSKSAPTYRYLFDHPLASGTLRPYGAFHGLELFFVFQATASTTYTPTSAEVDLGKTMGSMWGRFAATGDPNGSGLPAWPRYDASRDDFIVFDTPSRTGEKLHASNCDFWDGALPD